jgi:hypothetical protein
VPAISTRTQITPSASLTTAVVQGSLNSRGIGGEQGFKKCERMLPLPFGRHQQTGQYAMGQGTLPRACTETYFAKNNHIAQRLFGLVVGEFDL